MERSGETRAGWGSGAGREGVYAKGKASGVMKIVGLPNCFLLARAGAVRNRQGVRLSLPACLPGFFFHSSHESIHVPNSSNQLRGKAAM